MTSTILGTQPTYQRHAYQQYADISENIGS